MLGMARQACAALLGYTVKDCAPIGHDQPNSILQPPLPAMPDDNPLINVNVDLKTVGEAARLFVEKLSNGLGRLYAPKHITRMAKAMVDAKIIQQEGEIELTAIQQRAMARLISEVARDQSNIESISRKALEQLPSDAKPQDMDDDWIANFFDKCRIVSDDEMQSLWAKLLAGEATEPNTYSRRTVNFLEDLDKRDAYLFTNFCSYVWSGIGALRPLIFDISNKIYTDLDISFTTCTHLDDIGLIVFNNVTGFQLKNISKEIIMSYYGKAIGLQIPDAPKNRMDSGKALLTSVGAELAPICGSKPLPEFFDYVLDKWAKDKLHPNPIG